MDEAEATKRFNEIMASKERNKAAEFVLAVVLMVILSPLVTTILGVAFRAFRWAAGI